MDLIHTLLAFAWRFFMEHLTDSVYWDKLRSILFVYFCTTGTPQKTKIKKMT
jgi:hypothetical protein